MTQSLITLTSSLCRNIKSVLTMAKPLLFLAALTLCCCVGSLHGETFFVFVRIARLRWCRLHTVLFDKLQDGQRKMFFPPDAHSLFRLPEVCREKKYNHLVNLVLLILCSSWQAGLPVSPHCPASGSTSSHQEN